MVDEEAMRKRVGDDVAANYRCFSPPVDDRSAYADLAPRPGGWVSLTRLRAELSDADRGDIDTALRTLYRAAGVSLIPEENQKVLTTEDRHAAVLIGDQSKHLIAIGHGRFSWDDDYRLGHANGSA